MNRSSNDRGFTLIELLAGIVLLGLAAASLHVLYVTAWENWLVGQKRVEIQQYLRYAMEVVVRDLRSAESIDFTAIPPVITLEGGRQIRYEIAGTQLQREYLGATANPLGHPFQEIRLEYLGNNLIRVTLVTSESAVGLRSEVPSLKLETTVFVPGCNVMR